MTEEIKLAKLSEKLIALIDEIVEINAPYSEKRDHILMAATEFPRNNLEEFLSWFDKE